MIQHTLGMRSLQPQGAMALLLAYAAVSLASLKLMHDWLLVGRPGSLSSLRLSLMLQSNGVCLIKFLWGFALSLRVAALETPSMGIFEGGRIKIRWQSLEAPWKEQDVESHPRLLFEEQSWPIALIRSTCSSVVSHPEHLFPISF